MNCLPTSELQRQELKRVPDLLEQNQDSIIGMYYPYANTLHHGVTTTNLAILSGQQPKKSE